VGLKLVFGFTPHQGDSTMFFTQLHALAKRAGGSVTLTVAPAPDADQMTVVVTPKGGDKAEPALATPLVLTATPQEFDAGFLDALARYDAGHKSLADQVTITTEVLAAAKEAQVKKGTAATSKATSKPVKSAAAPVDDDEPRDDDEAGGEGEGGTGDGPAKTAPPVAPTAAATPNLFG
jgi:PRTRC genetic system protein E